MQRAALTAGHSLARAEFDPRLNPRPSSPSQLAHDKLYKVRAREQGALRRPFGRPFLHENAHEYAFSCEVPSGRRS